MPHVTTQQHHNPPPVPPPLNAELYERALMNRHTNRVEPADKQTEDQIKHIGWQVIDATSHSEGGIPKLTKSKQLLAPKLAGIKSAASAIGKRLGSFFAKASPFELLGGMLLTTALILLISQHQWWALLAIAGIAQFAANRILKNKV